MNAAVFGIAGSRCRARMGALRLTGGLLSLGTTT